MTATAIITTHDIDADSAEAVTTDTTTATGCAARRRPLRVRVLRLFGALLTALLIAVGVAQGAQADTFIAGVRFHTTVECGGSTMLFSTNTIRDSGSLVKLYVYDPVTARWVTDNIWQDAGAWASFHVANITFRPGAYRVYMSYAQYTTSGWQYSGEYMSVYTQRSGYSAWQSTTCQMR
jgi:hypothetical protein